MKEANNRNDSISNLGSFYELPPGITCGTEEAKSYLAGSYHFKVK